MADASWDRLLSEQIRQNGRLFFTLARRIVRDPAGAEDVCQRAFLQAWERRDEIGASAGALKGWLARTVINGGLQAVRRGKAEGRAIAVRAYQCSLADGSAADGDERRRSVLDAVDRLPEACRFVVAMRCLQCMTGQQVSELLGCSQSEVSRQLHRGMEQLRSIFVDSEVAGTR